MDYNKIFFFKGTDLLIKMRKSNPKDCYGIKLSKLINLGYARVNQLLTLFENLNLIQFYSLNRRTKGIKLTKKGQEIADNLIAIKKGLKKIR